MNTVTPPARYYWVNPANTADIQGPYREGDSDVVLPDGRTISRINGASPEWNLYSSYNTGAKPPTVYHDHIGTQLTFEGVVQDKAATVREEELYAQTDIDALLDERLGEVKQLTRQVLDQGVHVSAIPADMSTLLDQRMQYTHIRLCNLPDVTTFKIVDLWGEFIALSKAQSADVHTSIALLDTQALANAEVHSDELERLHGLGDWDAMAAYDITTGWPAPPVKPATKTATR